MTVPCDFVDEKHLVTPIFDVVDDRGPKDPAVFSDAFHNTPAGVRLRAWIILQQLVPLIEARLASGAWPRAVPAMPDNHPAFDALARLITFDCRSPEPETPDPAGAPD